MQIEEEIDISEVKCNVSCHVPFLLAAKSRALGINRSALLRAALARRIAEIEGQTANPAKPGVKE